MMNRARFIAGNTIVSLWLLIWGIPCFAVETEESFGRALVQAYEDKDHDAYVSLLHPLSRDFYRQRDSVAYEKRVTYLVSRKPPTQYLTYEIIITDISKEDLYDPSRKAVKLGSRWAVFPVAPTRILTIRVKEETEDGSTEFPHSVQAIVKTDGHWYMLWPTRFLEAGATDKPPMATQ